MAGASKKIKETYTANQVDLINAFRKLWHQNVLWTRSLIISVSSELNDLPRVAKRLLQNPNDFAKAFRPFYGAEKAEEFEKLLQQYIVIATKFISDVKAGNTAAVKKGRIKWYDNADNIAGFLSGINPYWSGHEWQTLLYEHIKMTENEITERLNGQYEAEIMQFDSIEDKILVIADKMSKGIIKQAFYR